MTMLDTDDVCSCGLRGLHAPGCPGTKAEREAATPALTFEIINTGLYRDDDGRVAAYSKRDFPRATAIKSCRECPYWRYAGASSWCGHFDAFTPNVSLPVPPHNCPLRAQAELLAVPDCRHDRRDHEGGQTCIACGLAVCS